MTDYSRAHVANILKVYRLASPEIVESGTSWYPRARAFAASLDSDVTRACAVVAILSPNASWKANKTLARKAYANQSGEGMGFPDKISKINRLFAGENPFDVVKGPKVTPFFSRILDPYDPSILPVIDRHAQDIADGKRDLSGKRKAPKGKVYLAYASAYTAAADKLAIPSQALQAITWEQWKLMHGINV